MRRLLAVALAGLLGAAAVPAARAAPPPATAPSPGPCPLATPAGPCPAPGEDALSQELLQALQAQARLQATKAALAAEITAAGQQQATLRALVEAGRRAIMDTLARMAEAEARFAAAQARADQARRDLEAAQRAERRDRALLAAWVRARYVREDGFVAYLLAADSFGDLLDREATLSRLAQQGTDLVEAVDGTCGPHGRLRTRPSALPTRRLGRRPTWRARRPPSAGR